MRIRNFRLEDIPSLAHIQQATAVFDGWEPGAEQSFVSWLRASETDAVANTFVITDDDDELITWSQAGTLEGVEGEMVGYTIVQMHQDQQGYHLLCQGNVLPQHRHRKAGNALLICALNRAQFVAADHIFAAIQGGPPVYFEVLFPDSDPAALRLAAKHELEKWEGREIHPGSNIPVGLSLYRRDL